MTFVKASSHRAYDKLVRFLGYKPQNYYNLASNNQLIEIPEDKLQEVLLIKGISEGTFKPIIQGEYTYNWMKTWSVL